MKKLINCVKIVIILALTSGLVAGSLFVGNKYGEQKKTAEFRKTLIDKGFAEFNSKTGEWQYKNMTEFLPTLDNGVEKVGLMEDNDVPLSTIIQEKKKIAKNK